MNVYDAVATGTTILILLGNGVVANIVLNQSKGQKSGWIPMRAGQEIAVAPAAELLAIDTNHTIIFSIETPAILRNRYDPIKLSA